MGFFDEHTYAPSGLSFISKEEKQVLINESVPFSILNVTKAVDTKYPNPDGTPKFRYTLVVDLEGEERGLGISSGVPSRDAMLDDMGTYLSNKGEPVTVKIEMAGRAQILVEA